jgi:RNA polymerase sigma factor (sigma-70 family)
MNEQEWLARKFEENRGHLRAVAYRILGSAGEADDAVQEAWLRLARSDAASIENLGGWLTTVIARVCLDALRSRASKREEALAAQTFQPAANPNGASGPERDALLADSVGIALLVVLERLTAAERIAFVLHDMFDVSFDEIASVIGRSPVAARQVASRARRRVRGVKAPLRVDLDQQRQVVAEFLAALRAGDVDGIVAVLDPDVMVRIDETAAGPGAPREIRGATTWAKGAVAFARFAHAVQMMLIDGAVGLVLAPGGRLSRALKFAIADGKIVNAEIIADPARLADLDLAVLE